MAKKRVAPKNESVSDQSLPSKGVNPLELAGPVSARVQIQGVLLAESTARRTLDSLSAPKNLRVNVNVSHVQYGADQSSGRLFVIVTFTLKAERESESEATPFFSIEASFALDYAVESIEQFEDDNFKAFAYTNGIFNAWPYWREYVQNTTARMGLPPIIVPVFRLH